ncbi:MAG: 4Fe-4S binding protein [Candidatus Lindowbacteria bacterium]|nr:4Fe-4S binding protein [Candidatus Lindowbacteria bacterium]
MGKYRIAVDMEKCVANNGCELKCLSVCPTKVIAHRPLNRTDPSGKVLVQATHPLLCNGCMACVKACEVSAITFGGS